MSKDGKWRSFPKVPHLLQYVISENYFGKVKINGQTVRQSLQTTVWSTAQLRLNDFLKENRENRNKVDPPRFSEAVEILKRELEHDTRIKPQSKKYRLWCLGKLQKTWPELWNLRLDEITPQACREWSSKLIHEVACHYYNNTLGTLKQVLQAGIKSHKANGGGVLENPAAEIKKTRIKQKELRLPEPSQFKQLVENVRKRSGGWGPRDGDLVEFLAYGGMRIKSEAVWVTGDDIDWTRKEIIVRGDPVTATKNSETRRVPILPDMNNLLARMKERLGDFGKGPILQVGRCNEAFARACKEIGIARLADEAFTRLANNLHPFTGEKLTPRMRSDRRAGFDVTFDVPKSVSLAYAYSKDERIMRAIRQSVYDTMEEMEAKAAVRVRSGLDKNADQNRTAGNYCYAEFVHLTARPEDGYSDPHSHVHIVVMNTTWDPEEKKWKALQMGDIRKVMPYYQSVFHKRLVEDLQKLGLVIKPTEFAFEIEGIPDDLNDIFSRRTKKIEETAERLGITDPAQRRLKHPRLFHQS